MAIELENVTFKMGVYTLQKEIKWEAAIRRKLQQMTLIFFLIVILLYLDKKKPTTISVTKTMRRMTKMNRMKTLCYWPWAVDLQQVTYLKESTSWMVRTYNIYHDSIPNYMTVPIYCLFFGLLSYDWFVCDVPFFQIWAHPPRTKKRFCKSNVSMPKIPCFRNYGEVDEIFRQNENLILMQGSFKNTYQSCNTLSSNAKLIFWQCNSSIQFTYWKMSSLDYIFAIFAILDVCSTALYSRLV